MNSCLVLAVEVDGREVTTIEGLWASARRLHPLQKAFLAHARGPVRLLHAGDDRDARRRCSRENPDPTEDDVRKALAGNLCRCTGYRQIVDAVRDAAAAMRPRRGARREGRAPRR